MSTKRVYNFNPGPAVLPLEAVQRIRDEFMDFDGMSVLEISHRSKQFDAIMADCQALIRKHFGIGDEYKVLFMGGGASLQFATALVPGDTYTIWRLALTAEVERAACDGRISGAAEEKLATAIQRSLECLERGAGTTRRPGNRRRARCLEAVA